MAHATSNPCPKFWVVWLWEETSIFRPLYFSGSGSGSSPGSLLALCSAQSSLLPQVHKNNKGRCQCNYDKGFQDTIINVYLEFIVISPALVMLPRIHAV